VSFGIVAFAGSSLAGGDKTKSSMEVTARMTHLVLFFVGSVYFINGLALLGLIEPRASAPLNIFVGTLLLGVTGYLVFPLSDLSTPNSLQTVFESIGYLLFALTFLYVGVINLTGHANDGLGWYCGWATIVAVCLAICNLAFGDVKSAALWMVWTVVFAAFFALIVLKVNRFDRATGWFVIVAGFTTCFIPGGLLILGEWNVLPNVIVVILELGTLAFFGIFLLRISDLKTHFPYKVVNVEGADADDARQIVPNK
jgi:hypothetical protein